MLNTESQRYDMNEKPSYTIMCFCLKPLVRAHRANVRQCDMINVVEKGQNVLLSKLLFANNWTLYTYL